MEGWCFTDSRPNFKAKEEAYKKGAPATLTCLVLFLGVVVWILSYREQKLTQIIIRSNMQTELQLNLASLYTRHLEWLVGSIFLEDLCSLHSKFCFLSSEEGFWS